MYVKFYVLIINASTEVSDQFTVHTPTPGKDPPPTDNRLVFILNNNKNNNNNNNDRGTKFTGIEH
jgi:hypothetical protein